MGLSSFSMPRMRRLYVFWILVKYQTHVKCDVAKPSLSSLEHIMEVFSDLKELSTIHFKLSAELGIKRQVLVAEDELTKKFTVAALGAFSAGKSTLINSLVGQQVCEVGIKPTTSDVSYITVPWATGAWEIVDTPGLDALEDENHKVECLTMARRADMALLIVNARQALRESELPLIEEFTKSNPEVAVVVNYWNFVESPEDQSECLRHVENTLYRLMPGANSLPIFQVDARDMAHAGMVELKLFLTERVSHSLQRGKKIVSAYSEAMRISEIFRRGLKTDADAGREKLAEVEITLEKEGKEAEIATKRYLADLQKDKKHLDEQIESLKDALEAQHTRLEEEQEQARVED
jgi:small GTP-binding protein